MYIKSLPPIKWSSSAVRERMTNIKLAIGKAIVQIVKANELAAAYRR